MTPKPSPTLAPLRASRKEGVPSFTWNQGGQEASGWKRFCDAARRERGSWSALSPEGGRLSALVLVGRDGSRRKQAEEILSGEGHVRSGQDGGQAWAGELAHAVGPEGTGWRIVLPLAQPVDVSSPAARAAWDEAAAAAAKWVSEKSGAEVTVAAPEAQWPLPWDGLSVREGAAAFVQDMQVARAGREKVMIKAERIDEAPKAGMGVARVKLQVGPMSWHLSDQEAKALVEQLKGALGEEEEKAAPKKRK